MSAVAIPVPAGSPVVEWMRRGLIHLAVALTNAGVSILVNRIIQTGTAPKYAGWGTGVTAAAVGQTALVTEAAPTTGGGRTACTESQVTTSVTGDTYRNQGTITATGAASISETGLFDAASGGNMLLRSNFATVDVDNGDSIAFTYGVQFVPAAV